MKKTIYFRKQVIWLVMLFMSLSICKNSSGQMVIHSYGTFCVGVSNIFTYSGPGSVTSWYASSGGVITYNSGNTLQVQWNSPVSGAYVTAYYTSGNVSYSNINISSVVTPSVTINANHNNICPGTSVTFTATPVNGGASPYYYWYIDGTSVSGGSTNTFTTSSLTNGQQVQCILNTSVACYSSYQGTSNTITMVVGSTQAMSVSISGNTSVCQGTQASFSASVTNGTGNLSYQWKKNGFNINSDVTGPPPYVLVLNAVSNNDVITCVVSSDGCASPATSNSLTISIVSPQAFTISPSPAGITFCQGNTVVFTANSNLPAYNYQWYMNGTPVSGATSNTFSTTATSVAQLQSVAVSATTSATCVNNTTASGNSQYIPFTVNSLVTPSISITLPTQVVLGTSAIFTANPANPGNNPTYQWQINGNNVSGATSSTFVTTINTGSQYQTISVVMNSNAACAINPATASNLVEIVSAYWENLNYVRVHTVLVRGIDTWAQVQQLAIGDKLQSTTYLDGIDRSIQSVDREVGPVITGTWKDLVKHYEYDAAGRRINDYMIYATAGNSGKFKTDAATAQPLYITSFFGEPSNAPTYSVAQYDESPLNRITKSKRPGQSWAGNNIGVSTQDDFNNTNEKVHIWNLDYSSSPLPVSSPTLVYSTGTLARNTTTDENMNLVISYTDLSGNLVLKKVQQVPGPGIEHAGWVCTYYVYDDLNRLRYIISPKAVDYLDNNGWNLNQTLADELCFKYIYDAKGRMTVKKQPGKGAERMIYDKKDRLVLTQHANQDKANNTSLTKNQWSFVLYDDLNRSIATGLLYNDADQATMQGNIDGGAYLPVSATISAFAGSGNVPLTVDYPVAGSSGSTNYLPGTDNHITFNSITHYDNYNYTGSKSFSSTYTLAYAPSVPGIEPTIQTNRTTGMVTGEKVRILDGDNDNSNDKFLFSTAYYDETGRALESQVDNNNMSNGSGADYQVYQYDFSGKLMSSFTSHKPSAPTIYTITSRNEFDKVGRLTRLSKFYNGSPTQKDIAIYSYDELGQLKTKRLAPNYAVGVDELELLTYDYNIQGWLTGINKDYALSNNNYSQWEKHFGMYLGYNNADNKFTGPQYNGNVTGIIWKSQGDNSMRKYNYTYDKLDRFTAANFTQHKKPSETTWSNTEVDFSTTVAYEDGNGNISSMKHIGVIPGVNNGVAVDDLHYSYLPTGITGLNGNPLNGNQLKQVDDLGTLSANNNGILGDFKDGNAGQDYWYDKNGNLVKDLNKSIKTGSNNGITYNFLNKPEKIIIEGKSTIEFTYDASGEKLKKKVTYADNSIRYTTYISDYVYEQFVPSGGGGQGDQLQYILHEEGRLKIITPHTKVNPNDYELNAGSTGILSWPGNKQGVFEYFIKDQLGNTRMVLTEEAQKEYYYASMEASASAQEAPLFGQVDGNGNPILANELNKTRVPYSAPGVWPGNNTDVVKLTATAPDKLLGPNMILKVMAGDVVRSNVSYYYANSNNPGTNNNLLSSLIGSFVNALGGGKANTIGKNQSTAVNGTLSGNPDLSNFLGEHNQNQTLPKAYLNIVFFDEQFKFIEVDNVIRATTGSNFAGVTTSTNSTLTLQQIAPKNGWVFVFLSNESDESVYFDNLAITQEHSRIAEENHYYPYGLKIGGICSRAINKLSNKYNYQGDFSEEEEESGLDEFDLRMYDPQIGRWTGLDPYDEFASGYVGMGNDPVNNVDPNGGQLSPPPDWFSDPNGNAVFLPNNYQWSTPVGYTWLFQAGPLYDRKLGAQVWGDMFGHTGPIELEEVFVSNNKLWNYIIHNPMASDIELPSADDIPRLDAVPRPPPLTTMQQFDRLVSSLDPLRAPSEFLAKGPVNDAYITLKSLGSGIGGYSRYGMTDLYGNVVGAEKRMSAGVNTLTLPTLFANPEQEIISGGRLGSPATRLQIDDIAAELESRGYTITGGGGRAAEEYLRPLEGGRSGGSYVDITATHPNYGTLRINTVDTYKSGLITHRELTNATRIRTQIASGEHLLLINKIK